MVPANQYSSRFPREHRSCAAVGLQPNHDYPLFMGYTTVGLLVPRHARCTFFGGATGGGLARRGGLDEVGRSATGLPPEAGLLPKNYL